MMARAGTNEASGFVAATSTKDKITEALAIATTPIATNAISRL
jgi:hypothetical protein